MKIRFLVHDASLTGAPMVCLNFIRWIHENERGIKIATLIYRDGPLRYQFERYGEVFLLWKYSAGANNWITRRLLQIYDLSRYLHYKLGRKWDVDYINSAASVLTYSRFLKSRVRKILHVHEMLNGLRDFCGRKALVDLAGDCSFIISASDAVERDLLEYGGIKSLVIHEFVDYHSTDSTPVSIKDKLNIPESAQIIGGCGRGSFRKGFDLFLKIAQEMIGVTKDVYFVWIGSAPNTTFNQLVFDNEKDRNSRILILDETILARSLMKGFDIFLIPSREDPFPLVAIENALNGIPLICFQDATGLRPLFRDNEDLMVSYESVGQIMNALNELLVDVDIRNERGKKFRVNAMEYTTQNQAPKIAKLLKSLP